MNSVGYVPYVNPDATDAAYAAKISYWTTPVTSCGDARGNTCMDYAAWTQAWTTIKG